MYTIEYRTKYGTFNSVPFIPNLTIAKVLYLEFRWWGCSAVRIVDNYDNTIWETPDRVIHLIDNPNPTPELPF